MSTTASLIMSLGRIKVGRWIACSCAILLLAIAPTSANICVLKEATVSQIRGHLKYKQESLGGVPVQVWKTGPRSAKVSLFAESETNAAGLFSFSEIPSGWYRLTFPLPGFEGDDFLIHLQGSSLFRWFANDWLEVGLGLPALNCPETSLKATRQRTTSADSKQK